MGNSSNVNSKSVSTLFLDFEFNQTTEELVNLVSCVTRDEKNKTTKRFWLHNNEKNQSLLRKHLQQYELIIGYTCVAEARSFISLNLDPLQFKWIDLFLEYRMITNHWDKLQWGWQLVDGKKKFVSKPPPKWERNDEDVKNGFKATHSLAEATFKLTKQIRDTKEKDTIRDLIISNPKRFTEEQREEILKYNASDVEFLPNIWKRIKEEYVEFAGGSEKVVMSDYIYEAMLRGRYSAHTAIMESVGYPINVEATKNFSKQITSILAECQRDINSQLPVFNVTQRLKGKEPIGRPFKWNKNKCSYTWDQKVARKWIEDNADTKKWMKTKSSKRFPNGQISLALEAWERQFQFKHDYPVGNFGAQMLRFLKLKQSLYGFSDSGGKRKNFWDSVGSDGRVRPYMNIYGAQSGRSQPAASGFMFLKPAWMRTLVEPNKNMFIAGVDYGQQEFFLSGLESGDKTMIEAYLSGDPYMFGAKLAGAIPEDGTREQYKIERDLFKNTYLGILYGMTKYGLAIKLTNDTGINYTEEQAEEQIFTFEESFPKYIEWKETQAKKYQEGERIVLKCGWTIGPDNPNIRSVLNVPIQGLGASIMRKAVDIAVTRGCKVIFTLHDAIYIEDEVGKEEKIAILMDAMREAFQFFYIDTEYYETSAAIKLDPFAWSPSYKRDSEMKVRNLTIPISDKYRDERAMPELERFSKYFEAPETDLL